MSRYAQQLTPMVEPPRSGRVFSMAMRPLLGDCGPSGRIRLDALARWIQDAAYADIEDAGLVREAIWVVRRTRIKVARFPRFGDYVQVDTFASGIGRMWAERRTTVRALPLGGGPLATPDASPALVEAVTLWIHLDPERRLPSPLNAHEVSVYAEAAGDRRFPHRLTHPRPGSDLEPCDWIFRRCDADLADHVNNAAYWEALEEELLGCAGELEAIDVELEFRAPAQPGRVRLLREGSYRWLTDADSDEVYVSMLVASTRATPASG